MSHFRLIDDELTCTDTDFDVVATGHIEGEDVLVVHAGSTARGDVRTRRFLDRGIVEWDKDRKLRFLVDFPFRTAHDAASFTTGGAAFESGWNAQWARSADVMACSSIATLLPVRSAPCAYGSPPSRRSINA